MILIKVYCTHLYLELSSVSLHPFARTALTPKYSLPCSWCVWVCVGTQKDMEVEFHFCITYEGRRCALTWKSRDIFIMANDSVSSQWVIIGLILEYFTLLEINVYSEQWHKVYDIFKILPTCDSNPWWMAIVRSCFAKYMWLFKSNRFWKKKYSQWVKECTHINSMEPSKKLYPVLEGSNTKSHKC